MARMNANETPAGANEEDSKSLSNQPPINVSELLRDLTIDEIMAKNEQQIENYKKTGIPPILIDTQNYMANLGTRGSTWVNPRSKEIKMKQMKQQMCDMKSKWDRLKAQRKEDNPEQRGEGTQHNYKEECDQLKLEIGEMYAFFSEYIEMMNRNEENNITFIHSQGQDIKKLSFELDDKDAQLNRLKTQANEKIELLEKQLYAKIEENIELKRAISGDVQAVIDSKDAKFNAYKTKMERELQEAKKVSNALDSFFGKKKEKKGKKAKK